ncbi:two-component regulator propeller domain-containing protein [Pedobacter sp. R20-19]|uniref:ligand-binding sensor domain-containing protein n=1 Tax=Pedobacter sp. R20-19 TaxID=1270196 RepID=UPI0004934859|nr:two-component regulator propeller domain-containing protein [Pedobacter sp. R20-19]
MKNKRNVFYSLLIIMVGVTYFPLLAQQKSSVQNVIETKNVTTSYGPNSIVRTIKQDRHGNIWLASGEGIIRYDGKVFTNMTSKENSVRFFSVLEDRKGNFWFASIGSGVYYYDGKSFRNFTTKDGLANDRVTNIYEDNSGYIWFGTEGGASLYDGKSFQNFKMNEVPPVNEADSVYTGPEPVHTEADSVHISFYQHPLPKNNWMHNDVNAISEDKTGKFWFGTRGYATVYDGKTFTTIINNNGKPFTNVRSIIKDKKGNIWLGGADGLWRYNGKTFTNFTQKFVGYIYEDKKGNIWTSSESVKNQNWVLSRYDEKSLLDNKSIVTEIKVNDNMLCGILAANDGSIWFGGLKGVYRYDANLPEGQHKTITDFKK